MVKWKKMNKSRGIQSRDNSDGTVNRQRREKGRGDKHKRGAAGRWNRQGNCIYDTWQW